VVLGGEDADHREDGADKRDAGDREARADRGEQRRGREGEEDDRDGGLAELGERVVEGVYFDRLLER